MILVVVRVGQQRDGVGCVTGFKESFEHEVDKVDTTDKMTIIGDKMT